MAIEAGAKNGIFPVDERTRAWAAEVASRNPVARRAFTEYAPDADARYAKTITIDLSKLEPTVSFPHLPSNARSVSKAVGVRLDQVVIGSCTNGRIEDLRVAARILGGRKVAKGLRCIVFPATQAIYLQALREGLVEALVEAGAAVSTPTCGPCLGGHMGILAKGERAIATTNRNFVGRMGHPESEVYLASPAVAAASAITGQITDPSEIAAAPSRSEIAARPERA
jgi:3-isopropylmalate/(R)-2-methylmalate dehydratase large subunit